MALCRYSVVNYMEICIFDLYQVTLKECTRLVKCFLDYS